MISCTPHAVQLSMRSCTFLATLDYCTTFRPEVHLTEVYYYLSLNFYIFPAVQSVLFNCDGSNSICFLLWIICDRAKTEERNTSKQQEVKHTSQKQKQLHPLACYLHLTHHFHTIIHHFPTQPIFLKPLLSLGFFAAGQIHLLTLVLCSISSVWDECHYSFHTNNGNGNGCICLWLYPIPLSL